MLIHNDALTHLRQMQSNSVDSLITDPPAGISFMGKDWDSGNNFIPAMISVFTEALRVMKPGAHGLVWALPRTSHWTATALEQAGFEVRDVITHLFGSGFPKSLDISKAIDKAAGAKPIPIALNPNRRSSHGNAEYGTQNSPNSSEHMLTSPASDEAKQWEGWGTALKPASEHWILIRKPISEKTIAANVLKWGTGGINIDECRIAHNEECRLMAPSQANINNPSEKCKQAGRRTEVLELKPNGRFPANLILDEVAAEMLDEQSGVLKSGARTATGNQKFKGRCLNESTTKDNSSCEASEGGASRFFYCAKASKKDRNEGNNHPTVKSTKLMEYLIKLITPSNGIVLDCFMGSGSTGVAAKRLGFQFIGIEKEKEYFDIALKRIG